jgi:hypothetical protein
MKLSPEMNQLRKSTLFHSRAARVLLVMLLVAIGAFPLLSIQTHSSGEQDSTATQVELPLQLGA